MPKTQSFEIINDNPSTSTSSKTESYPLLHLQKYPKLRSGSLQSTATFQSYLHQPPKTAEELRKIKIIQNAFITFLITSTLFLITFPPAYNHYANYQEVLKSKESAERDRALEKLKCNCERHQAKLAEERAHMVGTTTTTVHSVPPEAYSMTTTPNPGQYSSLAPTVMSGGRQPTVRLEITDPETNRNFTVPLSFRGSTCSPVLKCASTACNGTAGCPYAPIVGTISTIFSDLEAH